MKATLRASLALAAALLLASCPAFRPDPFAEAERGDLSIRVSGIAPWLLAALQGLPPAQELQARAFLYVSRARITVTKDDGLGGQIDVIPPVDRDLALNNSDSGNATESISIPGIPAGLAYTVTVQLYNGLVSETEPLVRGTALVDIAPGLVTNASLVCVPVSPTTVPTDGTPVVLAMGAGEEAWYSIPALAADVLRITQSTLYAPSFVFDAQGRFVAALETGVAWEGTLAADGPYYVGVAAVSSVSSSLTFTLNVAPKNEGSPAEPVALYVDTPHAFTVGPGGRDDDTSYYMFTTISDGQHWLDHPAAADLTVSLYSDAAFSSLIRSGETGYGFSLGSLAMGTTYFMTLQSAGEAAAFQGIVAGEAYAADNSENEGAPAPGIPVTLTDGAAHAASVGHAIWDSMSYYKFTTGVSGSERITITDKLPVAGTLSLDIYSSDNYSTGHIQAIQLSGGSVDVLLMPSVTYYLRVSNTEGAAADQGATFSITCTAQAIPDQELLALYAPNFGTLTAEAQYWKITGLTAGRRYRVWWDSATEGSGAYTGECAVSVYRSAFAGSYFLDDVSGGYNGGVLVTVPTGDTEIIIKVASANASTGTFALMVTGENEGAPACPIILTPGQAHSFPVGPSGRDDAASYYRFTLDAPSPVWFDYLLTNDGISVTLYSDPALTDPVASSMVVNGISFGDLAAGTWYLKVEDSYYNVVPVSFTGRLVESSYAAAHAQNEGSVSAPIALADAVAQSGTVGCAVYDRASYYSFTTGDTGRMLVDFAGASPGYSSIAAYLYAGADFSSGKWGKLGLDANGDYSIILLPNTSYYLKVANTSTASALSFSLTVSAQADPAPVMTEILVDALYTGLLTAETQYFEVTGLAAGKCYTIDTYSSGTLSNSAYKESWSGVYYSNWGEGLAFIAIPDSQSSLVLEIALVVAGNLRIQVYEYTTPTMFLRGTMNNWGNAPDIPTPMTQSIVNGDTVWTCTHALSAWSAHQFKFETSGTSSWAENWGTGEGNEAVYAGSNINYNATVAGDYTFTFNMSDMIWSVTPPPSP